MTVSSAQNASAGATGTSVSRSAEMTRYSLAMSCAVDSTWLVGGRRSTIFRPVASVTA